MFESYGSGLWSEAFVPLILAFLALVFIAPILDGVTQAIEYMIERSPCKYNDLGRVPLYIVTTAVGYGICWLGKFDFYAYLNLQFEREVGWLFTAMLLSGGTIGVRKHFELANTIPVSIWGGIGSAIRRVTGRDGDSN